MSVITMNQSARRQPGTSRPGQQRHFASRRRSAVFSNQAQYCDSSRDRVGVRQTTAFEPARDEPARDELRAIAQQLIEHEPAFQYSDEFESTVAEAVILAPPPESPGETENVEISSQDLHAYERSLFDVPLLTFEQEQHLFRKMNYLKFRSTQLRCQLKLDSPDPRVVQRIREIDADAETVRDLLVRSNLRLVNAFARNYSRKTKASFDDIRSEGHLALLRAVDCFNYSLGNRFSTYATWAIQNSAGRLSKVTFRDIERFVPVDPLVLREQISGNPEDSDHERRETRLPEIRHLAKGFLEQLNSRESYIIQQKFGLNSTGEERTFREIAAELGISSERVRQLQNQAIERLRATFAETGQHELELIFDK